MRSDRWDTPSMKPVCCGKRFLASAGLLSLGIAMAACTQGSPQPGESGKDVSGSPPASAPTSTEANTTSTPSRSASPAESSTPAAPSETQQASTGATATANSGNSGELVLAITAESLPSEASCHVFASKSGVTTGGGALAGATLDLGSIPPAGESRLRLLPGSYEIQVNCVFGDQKWTAANEPVSVVRGESAGLSIELSESS